MPDRLARLATATHAHWKRTVALALAGLVALAAAAGIAGGGFVDDYTIPGADSQAAQDLLAERFPAYSGDEATVVFAVEDGTLAEPDRSEAISAAIAEIAGQPHVANVADPLAEPEAGQVSADGRIAFSSVRYELQSEFLGPEAAERLETAVAPAEEAGIEVSMRGFPIDIADEQMVPIGELIGLAIAVLLLVWLFRSVVTMSLTLAAALIGLGGGMILLTFGSAFIDVPTVAPTIAVMLGLGAGIDYALLLVARYRERVAAGEDPRRAIANANRTSGVAVLTAGAIVVVAISGLLATGIPFVGKMGLAAAVVVATVAVATVALVPAMMGAGRSRTVPGNGTALEAEQGGFVRWARLVDRRPLPFALAGTLGLLALTAPVLGLELGQPDDGTQPEAKTQRVAYDRLTEAFGPGFNAPLLLGVALPGDEAAGRRALGGLAEGLDRLDGVVAVSEPQLSPDGRAAILTAIPSTAPQDSATSDLVGEIRSEVIGPAVEGTGAVAHVGGSTATFEDLASRVSERLPVFIGVVLLLSLVLLAAVFRSVLVPVVSAIFNLLSIGAAYGVVTLVFQRGVGADLLGVEAGAPIVSFVPLFMFAVLFGLSMDYNVFLQSRIREEHEAGYSAREAVVRGLAGTGKVITIAGLVMIGVFMGFVTDDDVIVKMMGLGLATAIAVDVAIVRMLVAPAVMAMLGERAWWMPGWLDRLLPTISLEGREAEEAAALPVELPGGDGDTEEHDPGAGPSRDTHEHELVG